MVAQAWPCSQCNRFLDENGKDMRYIDKWGLSTNSKPYIACFLSLLIGAFYSSTAISEISIASMDVDELLSQLNDDEIFLDEIVITATKREDTLFRVPVSVAVLGASNLNLATFEDLRSISSLNASLTHTHAQSTTSTTTFSMRGVGTEGNQIGFDSSVGIFIDGVYQSRPGSALSEFIDLEQLELMRGPQGTLFGRNTSVGALSLNSKKPQFDGMSAELSQTFGNYDLRATNAIINLPYDETFAFRIASAVRQRDGVLENANSGVAAAHDRDRTYIRAQALWLPEDSSFSARLIADESESNEECCYPIQLTAINQTLLGINAGYFGTTPLTLSDLGHESNVGLQDPQTDNTGRYEETIQRGLSLELNWEISKSIRATYIPATRDFDATSWGDLTSDSIFFTDTTRERPDKISINTQTHEMRFQGGLIDDRVDWLVGAFYIKEDISELVQRVAGSGFDVLVAGFFDAADVAGNGAANLFEQRTESVSMFTHNIIELTDMLDLTVGIRYVEESRRGGLISSESIGTNTACGLNTLASIADPDPDPANLGNPIQEGKAIAALLTCNPVVTSVGEGALDPTLLLPLGLYDEEFDDSSLTYLTSLKAQINPDLAAYFSYSKGFKSGGINLEFTGGGFLRPTFESEKVQSYELGVKSQLFDRTLNNSLALFYMDIEDYQLGVLPQFSFEIFNVEKASSYGLELESDWQINQTTRWKNSIAYSRATFDDDCAGNLTGSARAAVEVQCGEDLPKSPRIKAVTRLDMKLPIGSDRYIFVSPVLRHVGSYQPFAGRPSFKQASKNFFDLTVSVPARDDSWRFDTWVKNLTNEYQVLNAFSTISAAFVGDTDAISGFISEPRTYGATLTVNFKN